tara:strand:+ start:1257 stop:2429 length:1173 start_codon:yes stop_codon:yes gene_type:complete
MSEEINNLLELITPGEWGKDQGNPGGVDIGVIRAANFTKEHKFNKKDILIRSIEERKLQKKILCYGDILIEKSGGSPEQPVGRVLFYDLEGEHTCSNFISILRPSKRVEAKFLYFSLCNLYSLGIVKNYQQQTTGIINLQLADYLQERIYFPSFPEQKKISEILSCMSNLINSLDSKIEKLKILREAIKSKYFSYKPDHYVQIKKLKDICTVRQGLQIPIANRSNTPGENKLPYLTTSWINSNFAISKAEYIESPKESVILKENEFVVGRTGAVGKIFNGLRCVFHNNFFAVSLKEEVCKDYLIHFLNWNIIQEEILKRSGSTTIPDLNHGDFYSINIPLPSMEKQLKIVSKINSINELISNNQSFKTKIHQIQKGLSNDLLNPQIRIYK